MRTAMRIIRAILGFVFGLIAETFARLVILCDDDLTVNFDYLRRARKYEVKHD